MIHVKRSAVTAPVVLASAKSQGSKETAKIIRFHANQLVAPPTPPGTKAVPWPKFSVYSDDEVKRTLRSLFGGKCAYCESSYAETQPVDIEHYRPKGEVKGVPSHRGYYWLGATWENLLPSCIDCNRERDQTPTNATAVSSGKSSRFPILSTGVRAFTPNDSLANEKPALLNPCEDNPSDYLAYTKQGIVISLHINVSDEKERAEQSIAVFGLNRPALVTARLEVLRLLQARIWSINRLAEALDACNGSAGTVATRIEDILAHELKELHAFADPARPYSQMCSQIIKDFISRFIKISRT